MRSMRTVMPALYGSAMAKRKIERGDWLTVQVEVTAVWDTGEVTVRHTGGQKVTLREDSEEIIEVTKDRGRKTLFDKTD